MSNGRTSVGRSVALARVVVITASALVAALLVMAPRPAAADTSEPVTFQQSWETECAGSLSLMPQPGPDMGVRTSAPAAVAPGEEFEVRLEPLEISFPNVTPAPPPINSVDRLALASVELMYEAPPNAEIVDVDLVVGSWAGIEGLPDVEIVDSYDPARVVVSAPLVPTDEDDSHGLTRFTMPAVELTLLAAGAGGSVISTQVPGGLQSAGFRFENQTTASTGQVRCAPWPDAEPPILFETVIGGVAPDGSIVDTSTGWATECVGRAFGMEEWSQGALAFETSSPAEVVHGQVFNVRIAPQPASYFDHVPHVLTYIEVDLLDVTYEYELPMGASIEGAAIVDGTGFGWESEASIWTGDGEHGPARVVLRVPHVPSDGDQQTSETVYQLPAVDLGLRAEGPLGSVITTSVAGADETSAGVSYVAESPFAAAPTRCWPADPPAPPLFETTIVAGPAAVATSTQLWVDPAAVLVGGEVELLAAVDAPVGAMTFEGNGTELATVPVDPSGAAATTLPMELVGEVQVVASYSGAPGYEASTSEAVVVLGVPDEPMFRDVGPGAAFFFEIQWASVTGLSKGFPGPMFRPGEVVTRQAAAAFLYRSAGAPLGPDPVCEFVPFSDVPLDHPFCGEIAWAVEEGIAGGYDDGTFRPGDPVTRQAAAAFLYRLAGASDGASPECWFAPFSDVPLDHPFCGEIAWAVEKDITTGFDGGTFRPGDPVTRQAMVTFLFRLSQLR